MAFISCMIQDDTDNRMRKYQKDQNKKLKEPLVSKNDIISHLLEKAGF